MRVRAVTRARVARGDVSRTSRARARARARVGRAAGRDDASEGGEAGRSVEASEDVAARVRRARARGDAVSTSGTTVSGGG